MLANPTFPSLSLSRSKMLVRPVGAGHLVFGLAGLLAWIHLLDAAFVHPQVNANFFEHVAHGLLALILPPLAFLGYPRIHRAWRGAAAFVVGAVALSAGVTMHIVGVIKNSDWQRTDYTGVPMAFAGLVLLVLGVTLLTAAIPRWRYRPVMIPAVALLLLYVVAPLAMATYVTHAPRYVIEPQDLGAPYESVQFETSDGLTLRGWYVPSRNGAAVAVIHGSGGARIRPLDHARMLVRHGYGLLIFDSRGHGESDGATNALGWGAHPDAAAAADFLASRPDVEPGRIGLLGVSMGAEIAITSAAEDDGFAAIVADGPSGRTFGDTLDTTLSTSEKLIWGGPMLSMELLESALSGSAPPSELTSLSPRVTEPVLYIASGVHSAEEELVTKIASRSGGEHELWVIEGVGHTQGMKKVPQEYEARVIGFFDRLLLAE